MSAKWPRSDLRVSTVNVFSVPMSAKQSIVYTNYTDDSPFVRDCRLSVANSGFTRQILSCLNDSWYLWPKMATKISLGFPTASSDITRKGFPCTLHIQVYTWVGKWLRTQNLPDPIKSWRQGGRDINCIGSGCLIIIVILSHYIVSMWNSVTVLAGYESTKLVNSVSNSGNLTSVKMFCRCFVQLLVGSVLTFGMTCWGDNASRQDKNRLDKNWHQDGGWGDEKRERKHKDGLSSISDK